MSSKSTNIKLNRNVINKIKKTLLRKEKLLNKITHSIIETPVLSKSELNELTKVENETRAQIKVLRYLLAHT